MIQTVMFITYAWISYHVITTAASSVVANSRLSRLSDKTNSTYIYVNTVAQDLPTEQVKYWVCKLNIAQ
jgi:hypothetical protein